MNQFMVAFCSIYFSSIYFFIFNSNTKVNVYVIDSIVDITHREFGSRADVLYSTSNCSNPVEHGTHVAGIIGGYSVGVTTNVNLHSIDIIDCDYKTDILNLIDSIDWIIKNHQKPAIINLSLIPDDLIIFSELDDVISKAIESGIIFIASAGNNGIDRCNVSPATVNQIRLVGSISENGSVSSFSNYGDCITVYTYGENIISTFPNMKYGELSGTSQSTPRITGLVVEYILSKNGGVTQNEVTRYLNSISIDRKIF
jgi:serine protease